MYLLHSPQEVFELLYLLNIMHLEGFDDSRPPPLSNPHRGIDNLIEWVFF